MPVSRPLARAMALVLLVAPGAALAAQFDYSLYVGLEHSDNIVLSETNPISQNILTPGLNFTYAQAGSTVQANVAGTLQYNDYLGGPFSNQTLAQVAGQVNWTMLPHRLDFSFEDYAGVQPVDSLAANSPDNQQQTNVFALGPTLHFQFNDALRGQVELRYINSYASKVDDFNSSRGLAAFRLYHDLNPTDQISFNVEAQHVDFTDTTLNDDYNRYEVFGRYVSKLAQFSLDAEAGWSKLVFDHAGNDSDPLARLTLSWLPTPRSTLAVSGSYQYADAAQDMMLAPGQPITNTGGITVGNAVVDSEVYLERDLEATYQFHTDRVSLSVAPIFSKLSYINDPTFDQTGRGGSVTVAYRLRPTITLSAFGDAEKLDYQSLDRTDKTYRYGLDFADQRTQHWSWHVSFTRQTRNSDAIGQSYHENEVFLGVTYKR